MSVNASNSLTSWVEFGMCDQIVLIVIQILICEFFDLMSVVHSYVFIIMYRNREKMCRFLGKLARNDLDLVKE